MALLHRTAPWMIPFSLLISSLVNGLAYYFHPEKPGLLFTPGFFMFMLLLDRANCAFANASRIQAAAQTWFYIRLFATSSAVIVSLKNGFLLAMDQGLIEKSWYFSVSRTAALLVSISFILFGNYLPKMPSPWNHKDERFDWQGVHHFSGLAFLITGIVMFLTWSILPIPEAKRVTLPVVFTMLVLIVARKWYSVLTWKGHHLS